MTELAPLLSSVKMDWNTPENILSLVRTMGDGTIALDPCTDASNPCRATQFYTKEDDGLSQNWDNEGLTFANPPYGRELKAWAKKFCQEGKKTSLIILVPARPDTKWFQEYVVSANALCFWKGRLKFVGAIDPAPFPSLIAYWGNDIEKFKTIFGSYGWIP